MLVHYFDVDHDVENESSAKMLNKNENECILQPCKEPKATSQHLATILTVYTPSLKKAVSDRVYNKRVKKNKVKIGQSNQRD